MGSEAAKRLVSWLSGVCVVAVAIQAVVAVEGVWGQASAVHLCVGALVGVLLSMLVTALREPSND